jgi:hypothetical protein
MTCVSVRRENLTELKPVTSYPQLDIVPGEFQPAPQDRATRTVIASPEEFDQAPNDIEMLRRI